jgi:ABC-type nitrate/sulfonate/bicarbonate transport system substrate-binding protein
MRLALPDLVSNSYFPAIAAVELGLFAAEGLDMELELISPVGLTLASLRDGEIDFAIGGAHGVTGIFPRWRGAKLLCALSQGLYWLLVLRADLGAEPGDVAAVRGLRIAAAPGPDLGFRGLLRGAGIDPDRDLSIVRVAGQLERHVSFGVLAAEALADGEIDGFWANAMGAEVAVRSGVATKVLDVRRGLGPKAAFHFTAPVMVATDATIAERPHACIAAVRAIAAALAALKADPQVATQVAGRVFPPENAALIAELIRRDLPYYDTALSADFIAGMTAFQRAAGLLDVAVIYDDVVATLPSA